MAFCAVINLTLNYLLKRNQCLIHTVKFFTLFNLIVSLQVSTEIRVALNLTSATSSCKLYSVEWSTTRYLVLFMLCFQLTLTAALNGNPLYVSTERDIL